LNSQNAHLVHTKWYCISFTYKASGILLEMYLFVCFEPHENFLSYLTAAAIASEMAVNLDLSLALTAFSREASFGGKSTE
jgi:hypothetical protein